MPRLIKNIVTEVIEEKVAVIDAFSSIESQVGLEDYAKVFNFTGYLQNFTKVVETTEIPELKYYGIVGNNNREVIEIDISY